MTQPNLNAQTTQKAIPGFNRAPHLIPPMQHLTEERVREVVMETLIQFDLIPKVQKKKAITLE